MIVFALLLSGTPMAAGQWIAMPSEVSLPTNESKPHEEDPTDAEDEIRSIEEENRRESRYLSEASTSSRVSPSMPAGFDMRCRARVGFSIDIVVEQFRPMRA